MLDELLGWLIESVGEGERADVDEQDVDEQDIAAHCGEIWKWGDRPRGMATAFWRSPATGPSRRVPAPMEFLSQRGAGDPSPAAGRVAKLGGTLPTGYPSGG